LNAGRDIHQETTDSINNQFGLTLTRNDGKTINFAVLYLMGKDSLAYSLNKSLKEQLKTGAITKDEYKLRHVSSDTAQNIIDGYFNTYVGFKRFVQDETENVKQSGWSWTLGGRRRPVPELQNRKTFGFGQRKAVNTPIQGGAADLMKLGILRLAEVYKKYNIDATTLLYVHDEYVIEVKESQAKRCMEKVHEVMRDIFPKSKVPIIAEGGIFDNWYGLKGGSSGVKYRNDYTRLKLIGVIKK